MNQQDRMMLRLYQWQIEEMAARNEAGHCEYLASHSAALGALARQSQVVNRYLPHVAGKCLDWGCMHAPDSCLLQMIDELDIELHGCDLFPVDTFPVFHDYANLEYTQLDHPWNLPYADGEFDTVIADGVLEHVPNDRASLTELYRILKVGGRLIICCLPNRFSFTEFLARCINRPHHLRTYSLRETKSLLLHHGFVLIETAYYQMTPTLCGKTLPAGMRWLRTVANALWKVNPLLEKLWPINRLAANLFIVAEKVKAITWQSSYPRSLELQSQTQNQSHRQRSGNRKPTVLEIPQD